MTMHQVVGLKKNKQPSFPSADYQKVRGKSN